MKMYLMRLICAAVVCAVVRAMAGEGQGFRKLVCGAFLALTALSIPMDLALPELDTARIAREAREAVLAGEEQADAARASVITEALEAYIWNKAAALDLQLTVRVELTDERIPDSVTLTGRASAAQKRFLTEELNRELGLKEGDVTWIEPE